MDEHIKEIQVKPWEIHQTTRIKEINVFNITVSFVYENKLFIPCYESEHTDRNNT